MKRRILGAHLVPKSAAQSDHGLFQPQLEITESELVARVAILDERSQHYEANFSVEFKKRPTLARAFATAYVTMGNGLRKGTVKRLEKDLKLFLGPFLDGMKLSFGKDVSSPEHVTREITDCYLDWLGGKLRFSPALHRDKLSLSPTSFGPRFRQVRRAFEILSSSTAWRDKLSPDLSFKANPTPGAHEEIKHRTALSEADLRLIRYACQREVTVALAKLMRGQAVLQSSPTPLDFSSTSDVPFKSLACSLRAYMYSEEQEYYGEDILNRNMPGFARATRGRHFTKQELREHLHLTASTIISFVCLCEMELLFSVDSHLLLEWKDIGSAMTKGRIRVEKLKKRGSVLQVKTLKENDNYRYSTSALLASLRSVSNRTRDLAPQMYKDRVFLFVDAKGRPKGFITQNDSNLFRNNLLAFIRRNKLPHFTLAQLRPTASSITNADIVSAKQLLNHETLTTTENSYDNDQSKIIRQESIGFELSLRERMLTTGGRIDPRGRALSPREKTATTLGFGCLDPLHSPMEGQIAGKMCSAYGACPACPKAFVDVGSATAAHRLAQLLQLFNDIRVGCAEPRWRKYWAPQVKFLSEVWLPAFSTDILNDAAKLKLSAIPGLE